MDLSELQGLLAQFQPTPEERAAANKQGILAASLGLLGARRGQEFDRLGQAGLLGLQAQNGALQQMIKDRQANLQGAATLSEMMRKAQFANQLVPDARPQIGSGGPAMPLSAPATASPAPPTAGPAAPPQQPQGVLAQLKAMGVPDVAIQTAAMSSDPVNAVAALVKEYSQPVFGQGKIPLMRGPNGSFKAVVPEGFNQALAEQTAAETTAQEKAKAPFSLQTMNLPGGGTQQLFMDQMQQMLRGQQGAPVQGKEGNAGQAPSPAQQGQDTEISKTQGKEYTDLVTAERMAPGNIGKLNLMKDYLSNVNTGKAAPAVMKLKAYASYFAPELAKSWTNEVPYAQAASALSNEMALQLRNPAGGAGMPGSLSNSDRDFLTSMTANAANDPRAIPMMLDARIALEKRSQEVGKLARQYRQQNGKIDEGFYQQLQDFSDKNPLFPNAPQAGPQAQGAPQVVRRGVYNGKRVVQYSDGRIVPE